MMATTHVFAGVALAAVVAVLAPEFALVVVAAALVGGLFPDLDLYAGHRKTLHFPVYYSIAGLVASAVAVRFPSTIAVAVAAFLLAAALHSASDTLGGGLELRPWLGTSDRAVYSHYHGRWIRPRRWIRYDGAPEDLLVATVLAVPGLVIFDGVVREVLVVLLVVSALYALARKPLVAVAERLVAIAPSPVVETVPDRFLPIEEDAIESVAASD